MHILSVLPLALSVSAFLVPASVDPVHVNQLPPSFKAEVVKLQCKDCPTIAALDRSHAVTLSKPGQTTLSAEVVIKDGKVNFNGQQIYPKSNSAALLVKSNFATDLPSNPELNLPVPISSSIEYKMVERLSDGKTEMTIHPIVIEILAVQNILVHAESVEITVVEDNGKLGLLPSKIRVYEPSPFTDSCTTIWCRVKGTIAQKFRAWRSTAANKINSWKGCFGNKRPALAKGKIPIKGGPAKYGGSLRPAHHDEKPSHGQGQSITSFIGHLLHAVLLPGLFGLCAGLIVGAFSWLIVSQVRRIRAARRGQYIVVEQMEVEEGRCDFPPKYEDAYQEGTEDEKKVML